MLCAGCGQPVSDADSRSCPHCGADSGTGPSRSGGERALAFVLRAAAATSLAVRTVLESQGVRSRLTARSYALSGARIVGLAVLMARLPLLPGPGLGWSAVLFAGVVPLTLLGLHADGRPLSEFWVLVARMAQHPLVLPVFTLLTAVQTFILLSGDVVPLLLLLATLMLLYEQWDVFVLALMQREEASPEERRRARFLLGGALVCLGSLLFAWEGPGGGYFLGGGQPVPESPSNGLMPFMPSVADSGRARPFASLVVLGLGVLVMLSRSLGEFFPVPPWVTPWLAVVLTFWGLVNLAAFPGPWFFLAGMLVIDVAVKDEFRELRA